MRGMFYHVTKFYDKAIIDSLLSSCARIYWSRQTILLENQRMKPFLFPSTKFLLEVKIFTSFCLIFPLVYVFL